MDRHCLQMAQMCRTVLGAFMVIAGAACSSSHTTSPTFCAAPNSIAIEVAVHDSISGALLTDSASGMVANPSAQDLLRHIPGDTVLFGGNQVGIYTVSVHHPAYADWDTSGVIVSQTGPCGNVLPVNLTARLTRSP